MIFCRNVIMYFTPETAQAVIARLARALAPGGYLFLGHAETLRGLSHDFHLRHTHGTFYYQRRDEPPEAGAARAARRRRRRGPGSRPSSARASASARWRPSATCIDDDPRRCPAATAPSSPTPRPPPARAAWRRGAGSRAGDRVAGAERYTEALAAAPRAARRRAADPDALLLRAALLTHSGRLDEAERACAELLALDELNAGAHYLLALCREGRGDRAAAIEHDQVAVYLDPAFAMPRLHLGLLARRAGRRDARAASSAWRLRSCSAKTPRACCSSAAASTATR